MKRRRLVLARLMRRRAVLENRRRRNPRRGKLAKGPREKNEWMTPDGTASGSGW